MSTMWDLLAAVDCLFVEPLDQSPEDRAAALAKIQGRNRGDAVLLNGPLPKREDWHERR